MNYAWAETAIRELSRLDVEAFFIAPGSRSSPLAISAAESGREVFVHPDERGLGFAALGYARCTGRPPVVITTSGSAVANLWPAVCEASTDHVPMIILSADRPPELRDTGANQAMDQVKLFGNYVRWQVDLPCPDVAISARYLVSTMDEAFYRAMGPVPGPVHLNQMFREPLAPVSVRDGASDWLSALGDRFEHGRPWTTRSVSRSVDLSAMSDVVEGIRTARRGVIVVGELREPADRNAVLDLAARLQWPVLPDVRSGLRFSTREPLVMHMADQCLLSPRVATRLKPDYILHLGGRIVSKRIQQFLVSAGCPWTMVREVPDRIDPDHMLTGRICATPVCFAGQLMSDLPPAQSKTGASYVRTWSKVNHAVASSWSAFVRGQGTLNEPGVAAAVSMSLGVDDSLVLASSMPVRDMEMYGMGSGIPCAPVCNRGVSGIDGTVATAAGVSLATKRPVTLVLGDLALLHDLNSLLLTSALPAPMTIVVINNDGGAIFSFLPVAGTTHHFEKCFGTPHGCTFKAAAELFGLDYHQPASMAELQYILGERRQARSSAIVEVRTGRAENLREHKRIQALLAKAAEHAVR